MSDPAGTIKLGDIAEFIRGITFKPDDVVPSGTAGSVQCMRTKNVQSQIDLSDVWSVDARFVKRANQYLRTGDILVSSANSWNLVGKCCWVPEEVEGATIGGFISTLRPNREKVDPRYLYRWFSSDRVQATVRSFGRQTTNISNLDFTRCLDLPVPLPSFEKQRQITLALDSVDALRVKRREAITLLDSLKHAIFFEMFGDPLINRMGWTRLRMSDFLLRIDSGKSPRCLSRPAMPDEWGILKLGAVTRGVYLPGQNKALPVDSEIDERNVVKTGDLLFSRKNTPDLVAASVYVRETRGRLLLPDLIFRFIVNDEVSVDKVYLHGLLTYPSKRRHIQGLATGSAASMSNISKSKLLDLECEIPPVHLQHLFAARLEALENAKLAHFAHLAELDSLFASLQHHAFCGELWDIPAA